MHYSIDLRYYVQDEVQNEIKSMTNDIDATTVCLFSMNPLNYDVCLESYAGDKCHYEEYRFKLRYSPLKDVAIVREVIFEKKIGHFNKPKHRWLHRAFNYESCIGEPLSLSSELAYCLFAFSNEKNKFKELDYYKFKLVSEKIARLLEKARIDEIRMEQQPFVIGGKSYGVLGHELKTILTNQNFLIDNLKNILEEKSGQTNNDTQPTEQKIFELQRNNARATKIVSAFRRTVRGHHEKSDLYDLSKILYEVRNIMEFELEAMDVNLKYAIPDSLPKIKGREAAIEQLFFNLLMNAAQQIEMFRSVRETGHIWVELDKQFYKDKTWLIIQIHDTGPGVHGFNFENIFKSGFTTRKDGLGLGLDIAKEIVESLNGSIRVKQSTLFVGTTFEIKLPGL